MFSRFTNALYNAVDALSPPHPLQEDFVWHWKSVTKFYTGKNASNSIPIESTTIPGHLKEMLSILEQEENETEIGNIGPCMEYLMQHKLLDTMCVLASSDSPPGMKLHMFNFITKTLSIIQESLIPHVSICVPIQSFMKLCGEVVGGPTESEEMCFLEEICNIIDKNPHMFNSFFMGDTAPASRRNSTIASKEDSKEVTNDYVLITSLLKLYQSPDNSIFAKVKDCIKKLCACANDSAAVSIVQSSSLSQKLCSNLISLYNNIPKTLKPQDIENPVWEDDPSKISSDMRKYLCYLQHLSFLDNICLNAHPIICEDICAHVKSDFLIACIYPILMESDNEDNLLTVTTFVMCNVRAVESLKLVDTYANFLLEEANDLDLATNYRLTLRDILIERCNDCDKEIALAMCTLQLFEELLVKPTQYIINNLVLKYIDNRGYYDYSASDSWFQFSDDDSCSRYSDDLSENSSPTPKTHAPTYVNRIIEGFLALLPDYVKSCDSEEDSGYETYVKEAHNRFVKCLIACEDFDWLENFPDKDDSHLGTEDDSSSESQPEADSARYTFYEGPFLNMIFDRLEQMLYQPYEINLQLTAIISRIVLFANLHIHEYFLNPLIPCAPGVRSLFSVLYKISEDIQKKVPDIGGFKTKLKLTRNALLSDGNEYATFEESSILEALIVLEEFCKELAAITFVKYHAS